MQVSNFLSNFDGGARNNLFEVELSGNFAGTTGTTFPFHCKATSFPGAVQGTIPLNYRGRVVNIPGDRTYEDWSFTVINDENLLMKQKFIQFQNVYNHHNTNTPSGNKVGKDVLGHLFGSTATVYQLNRQGGRTLGVKLSHCWIDNIGGHDLSWDTVDAISEFTVSMKFHDLLYIPTNTNATGGPSGTNANTTNPPNSVEATGQFGNGVTNGVPNAGPATKA